MAETKPHKYIDDALCAIIIIAYIAQGIIQTTVPDWALAAVITWLVGKQVKMSGYPKT